MVCFPAAEPVFVSMSHTHIITASLCAVHVWHYRSGSSNRHSDLSFITGRKDQEDNDKLFHIDDTSVDARKPLTVDFQKASMVSQLSVAYFLIAR